GRAEAAAALTRGGVLRGVRIGVRRYVPYFPLWTVWGVFSPSAYTSGSGRVDLAPLTGVRLWAGGERYRYEDTGASAPLFATENDGWRWSAGAGWSHAGWDLSGGLHTERGPGASSRGYRAALGRRLGERWSVRADGSSDRRPLEFRFADSTVRTAGLALDGRVGGQRIRGELRWVDESLDRPDAGAFEESGWRIAAAATFEIGSGTGVPPAVLRIPRAGGGS
ncbi:MAG: hypothetical protein HKN12_08890, partial [Gemmatimonadetes bacterium]|nr:hypothetical protein [Gemmatimonadota bacterium]